MTNPDPPVPSDDPIAPAPTGDYSTSLWGTLFLPLGSAPGLVSDAPLPEWAAKDDLGLLRDADPALFAIIDFFRWTIEFDLSQRLLSEATARQLPVPSAVASVSTVDPLPFFTSPEAQFQYPLLAVWRQRSRGGMQTVSYPMRTGRVALRYVLPALSYDAAKAVEPIRHAVEAALDVAIYRGFHPQYAPPGGNLGDLVFKKGGAMEVSNNDLDSTWEYIDQDGNGVVHLSYLMELDVKVMMNPVPAFDPAGNAVPGGPVPFAGVDASTTIETEGGALPCEDPVPVAEFRTDGPIPGPQG